MDDKPQTRIEKLRAYCERESISFAKLLVLGFSLSLLASLYYFFDLFSHFVLQYTIGGLILGAIILWTGHKRWALVVLAIGVISLAESRIYLASPLQFQPPGGSAVFRLVTYNHNYGRSEFGDIALWLSDPESRFDVVILQEATAATVEMASKLGDIYPFQIHEPRDHAFGMVVLSKHKFQQLEKIALAGPLYNSFAIKLTVKTPKATRPLTIFALHPYPPTGPRAQAQRNFELFSVARKAAVEQGNVVMMGDWNVTPFAPAFRKTLNISGLNYQSYGFLLNPTWPTFNLLPFLKIPIDHALYSDTLEQLNKQTGPAFMSDHHALIVDFGEKL